MQWSWLIFVDGQEEGANAKGKGSHAFKQNPNPIRQQMQKHKKHDTNTNKIIVQRWQIYKYSGGDGDWWRAEEGRTRKVLLTAISRYCSKRIRRGNEVDKKCFLLNLRILVNEKELQQK